MTIMISPFSIADHPALVVRDFFGVRTVFWKESRPCHLIGTQAHRPFDSHGDHPVIVSTVDLTVGDSIPFEMRAIPLAINDKDASFDLSFQPTALSASSTELFPMPVLHS
jgi:hypothetical protein